MPTVAARKINYELRAHGDHNPRHGGQFFMATDAWHHVEGTYPENGLFRVFFYDNFTKPLALKGKRLSGPVAIRDAQDKEIASAPLAIGQERLHHGSEDSRGERGPAAARDGELKFSETMPSSRSTSSSTSPRRTRPPPAPSDRRPRRAPRRRLRRSRPQPRRQRPQSPPLKRRRPPLHRPRPAGRGLPCSHRTSTPERSPRCRRRSRPCSTKMCCRRAFLNWWRS